MNNFDFHNPAHILFGKDRIIVSALAAHGLTAIGGYRSIAPTDARRILETAF